jgi:hypothetical protein
MKVRERGTVVSEAGRDTGKEDAAGVHCPCPGRSRPERRGAR